MGTPVTLSLLGRLGVAERQERKPCRQVRVGLAELFVGLVDETAVVLLSFLDRLEQFAPPIVFLALGVLEGIFAQGGHRLAEGVVVIKESSLAHAGVLVERVMAANPVDGALAAR